MTFSHNWYCNGCGLNIVTALGHQPDGWQEVETTPMPFSNGIQPEPTITTHLCRDCIMATAELYDRRRAARQQVKT